LVREFSNAGGKEGWYVFQKDELCHMKQRLEGTVQNGTDLYLDGRKVSAAELAWTCCVNEEAVYMPDYVMRADGSLAQLRYDRVRQT